MVVSIPWFLKVKDRVSDKGTNELHTYPFKKERDVFGKLLSDASKNEFQEEFDEDRNILEKYSMVSLEPFGSSDMSPWFGHKRENIYRKRGPDSDLLDDSFHQLKLDHLATMAFAYARGVGGFDTTQYAVEMFIDSQRYVVISGEVEMDKGRNGTMQTITKLEWGAPVIDQVHKFFIDESNEPETLIEDGVHVKVMNTLKKQKYDSLVEINYDELKDIDCLGFEELTDNIENDIYTTKIGDSIIMDRFPYVCSIAQQAGEFLEGGSKLSIGPFAIVKQPVYGELGPVDGNDSYTIRVLMDSSASKEAFSL